MSDDRKKITALLPTFNNERSVRNCLESVKWADEILVVDSFSTDGTLNICREYGAKIIQHPYVNSAKQKNWAIPYCSNGWVLQIDSDETLEEGAREEIINAIASADSDLGAFRIPRKNFAMGVWARFANAYPDYVTRLFRREEGRFEDKEVHAHLRVSGRVGTLRRHILHEGMPYLSKQLTNLDRYTRYQADELRKRGKHFHWYHLVLRPWVVFAYYFFWKCGFRMGYRGLLIAMIQTSFDFWSHAKLWEIEILNLPASPK